MKYLTTAFILFFHLISQAQDYEHYMSEAKSLAVSEKYYSADSLVDLALENFVNDHDLLCLKARICSWHEDLVAADSIAEHVLVHYPEDLEAFRIKATLSYWSGNSEKLLTQAQEFLSRYPDEIVFKYYEAYAYYKLGVVDKSTNLVRQLLEINSEYLPGIRLLKEIKSTHYSFWETEVTYAHFSSTLDPWQQIRVGYGVNKKLPWNGHVLAVNRFNVKGFSLEMEAYPRLTRKSYAFIVASYSPNSFMANYTAGLELFQSFQNFEISVGSKRFKFDRDEFFLHKASLGFYKKKYFANYQILLSKALNTNNYTHILRMRGYLGSGQYLEGEVISGTNVQEYFNPEGTTNILENKSAGLKYSARLMENSALLFGIRVRSEEYRSESSRTRIDFQMGIKIKLH
ncbi:MAG: YaiO family outer membrane beta-barrel protein [Reichenbachiella sp.]|uniref:YaiO family outer membrane beta-barrel protein n=1 Tax=Reichenbachiella sp. TaxID=2184521 RepID=UPI003265E6AD